MGRPKSENPLSEQALVRLDLRRAAFLDALLFTHPDSETSRASVIRGFIDDAMENPEINTPQVQMIHQVQYEALRAT